MSSALVILAAGMGTRMKSDLPKVLHEIGNAPLLGHAIRSGQSLSPDRIVVVTGHGAELVAPVAKQFAASADVVSQENQLGTADAVKCAKSSLDDFEGDVFVLYGDTPFISAETLGQMAKARADHADLVVLGFEAEDPGRYGRLILGADGRLERIVEYKDATPAEQAINLCNSGVLCAARELLFSLLSEVRNDNAKREFYLTDIVGLARAGGHVAAVVQCPEAETMGCDSRSDLAAAEAIFQTARRSAALEQGVTLQDPETVYFSFDTELERDVRIEPHVVFGKGVRVEAGTTIKAFSHLEETHIGPGASVGPHVRMRGGTVVGAGAKIGNFVETKNAHLAPGVKAGHLSYLGDTEIGAKTNIGAGTITCNYDGKNKHRTEIGAGVFVGSNTALVAPLTLGDGAVIAAGSTVTEDVGPDEMAIARGRQVTKSGAARIMERIRQMTRRKG